MTYRFRLEEITFNDGTTMKPGAVTVFIGPNNVGKSRVLQDLVGHLTGSLAPSVVLKSAVFTVPRALRDLTDSVHDLSFQPGEDNYVWHDLAVNLCGHQSKQVPGQFPEAFSFLFEPEHKNVAQDFCYWFGGRLVAHLTTATRLQLLQRSGARGYDQPSQTILHMLMYESANKFPELAAHFREAFRREIFLDYSALSQIVVRVLTHARELPDHPRALYEALKDDPDLDTQGDGMRAFAGIAAALAVVGRPVVLIDEPETFLHPPQAKTMGKLIASAGSEERQIFVATHSVDVLLGLLASQKPTRIVRLTRDDNRNNFEELDPALLKANASDPLQSSARVLDGLFHQAVAVVEGESDARFLGTVAGRLGGNEVHFVSAGGKQATNGIVEMYRRVGVRSCTVLDFDAFRDLAEFRAHLRAHGVDDDNAGLALRAQRALSDEVARTPTAEHRARQLREIVAELRAQIESVPAAEALALVASRIAPLRRASDPWGDAKRRGLEALEEPVKSSVAEAIAAVATQGLFISETGELESLLSDDFGGSAGSKAEWVRKAIPLASKLEVDRSADPWKFVDRILRYLGANQ